MPERIEITKMKQNSNNREYVIENAKPGYLPTEQIGELNFKKEIIK